LENRKVKNLHTDEDNKRIFNTAMNTILTQYLRYIADRNCA